MCALLVLSGTLATQLTVSEEVELAATMLTQAELNVQLAQIAEQPGRVRCSVPGVFVQRKGERGGRVAVAWRSCGGRAAVLAALLAAVLAVPRSLFRG